MLLLIPKSQHDPNIYSVCLSKSRSFLRIFPKRSVMEVK